MGLGISGIELERRFVTANRFVVAAETFEDLTQVVAADRRIGAQLDGALHERERRLEVVGLQRDNAEQVQRVGVRRRLLQQFPITALRLGQPPRPMVIERNRERLLYVLRRHAAA